MSYGQEHLNRLPGNGQQVSWNKTDAENFTDASNNNVIVNLRFRVQQKFPLAFGENSRSLLGYSQTDFH